jgi:hypothetical protein
MKIQDDAEKADGAATAGTTSAVTTPTTTPKKAAKGGAKKRKAARTEGDEAEGGDKCVKPIPKRRKVAATKNVEGGTETESDEKAIRAENVS